MRIEKILQTIGKLADREEVKVYIVGGYVRDEFLKRKSNDLDFVVVGMKGVDFAKKAADELKTTDLALFEKFDTAKINFGIFMLEFVGARKEVYQSDSRKPDVESADLKQDLLRRDFTMNAMARGLNKDNYWELYDYFNGITDLNNKIIQTTQHPKKVFDDDPLRMIRSIRFAAQLDFDIDPKIIDQIKKSKQRLDIISYERIRDELFKILLTKKPSIGLWHLFNTSILKIILPELAVLYGIEEREGIRHKNILTHTFQVVDNLRKNTNDVRLIFAALIHDIGKEPTKEFKKNIGWTFHNHEYIGFKMARIICKRFRLSKEDSQYICKIVKMHAQPVNLAEVEVTDSAVRRLIVKAGEELTDLLTMVRADLTSKNVKRREEKVKNYDKLVKHMEEVKEKDKLTAFQSPVRGEEIMKIAKLEPGPEVGKLKTAIEEAILDGEIPNEYGPALEYLHGLLKKKS